MLTAQEISEAKTRVRYGNREVLHEHDDCIRIAYEWLDEQTKIKGLMRQTLPIKHIIEKWADATCHSLMSRSQPSCTPMSGVHTPTSTSALVLSFRPTHAW